jgi:hypothetical protein
MIVWRFVGNCHATPILGQIHPWPRSFSTSEFHVCLLDLTARKLFFNVEVKANQNRIQR